MVDLVFAATRRLASQGQRARRRKTAIATVDLTQTNFAGQRIVTHKVFDDLDFGAGTDHKVVFLEGATCMPLVVDVHAGKSSKTARLGFKCDPAQAAQK